jgi:hypothetical protein
LSTFEYLSVFISIVIGLAVVHALRGLVQLFGGPGSKPYWIHTGWVLYLIYWLPYFWWFTLDWQKQQTWVFPLFFFVVLYSMLVYVLCVVLVPLGEISSQDMEAYYFKNHRKLFSIWTVVLLFDVVDAFLKGPENVEALGPTYVPVTVVFILSLLVAAITPNRRYHAALLVVWLVSIGWDLITYADVFSG